MNVNCIMTTGSYIVLMFFKVDDLPDDHLLFDVKFEANKRIRTKKYSLMIRDLIHSVFTEEELEQCTLSGRRINKRLDPVRLGGVKSKLNILYKF